MRVSSLRYVALLLLLFFSLAPLASSKRPRRAPKRPRSYTKEDRLTPELYCSACHVTLEEIEYRLGKTWSGRLGGRTEVAVAEAMDGMCNLALQYAVSGSGTGQRFVRTSSREGGSIMIESASIETETPKKLASFPARPPPARPAAPPCVHR